MYIWGFRAGQHFRSLAPLMNDYGWKWWSNDIRGPWGPKTSWHMSYRWGKTPKKRHPGNLYRPGIEPGPAAWQARMLPPVPQRWTVNCVNVLYLQVTVTNVNEKRDSNVIDKFMPYLLKLTSCTLGSLPQIVQWSFPYILFKFYTLALNHPV